MLQVLGQMSKMMVAMPKILIAPNVETAQNLTFKVATEVKSQLDFSGLTIDTNLPKELQQFILVQVCGAYHGLDALVADPSVAAV